MKKLELSGSSLSQDGTARVSDEAETGASRKDQKTQDAAMPDALHDKLTDDAIAEIPDAEFARVSGMTKDEFRAAGIPVMMARLDGDCEGCYDASDNAIYIDTRNADDMKAVVKTLKHELTHLRQVRTGVNVPRGFCGRDVGSIAGYMTDIGELEARYAEDGRLDDFAMVRAELEAARDGRMSSSPLDVEVVESGIYGWDRPFYGAKAAQAVIDNARGGNYVSRNAREVTRRFLGGGQGKSLPARLEEFASQIERAQYERGGIPWFSLLTADQLFSAREYRHIPKGAIAIRIRGKKDASGNQIAVNAIGVAKKLKDLGLDADATARDVIQIYATERTMATVAKVRRSAVKEAYGATLVSDKARVDGTVEGKEGKR